MKNILVDITGIVYFGEFWSSSVGCLASVMSSGLHYPNGLETDNVISTANMQTFKNP